MGRSLQTASPSKWERARLAPGMSSNTFAHHRKIFLSRLGILLLSFSSKFQKTRASGRCQQDFAKHSAAEGAQGQSHCPTLPGTAAWPRHPLSHLGALQGLCPVGSGCCELGDALGSVAELGAESDWAGMTHPETSMKDNISSLQAALVPCAALCFSS